MQKDLQNPTQLLKQAGWYGATGRYGAVQVWYWVVRGGSNFPGVVLSWLPGKNDKSGSSFVLGNSGVGLAPEVLALGGSNLPSGSVRVSVQPCQSLGIRGTGGAPHGTTPKQEVGINSHVCLFVAT